MVRELSPSMRGKYDAATGAEIIVRNIVRPVVFPIVHVVHMSDILVRYLAMGIPADIRCKFSNSS